MNKNLTLRLEIKATEARMDILEMIVRARGTHIASAFSIVDLVTYLYDRVLRINPKKPTDPRRDKFVLSKGHGCAGLYIILANHGFFPKSELLKYCTKEGILGGHPDSTRIPGVETSTGSLGHGFPVAVGFALANKINKTNARVYCIVGDGECNEGSVWEAAQVAPHHKLNNLTLIVDDNKLMISGFAKDILNPLSLSDKFRAFGWNTIEIDGHNFKQIISAFNKSAKEKSRPTVIIANTVKGKGVSFMENEKEWYSKLPNDEEFRLAMLELKERVRKLKRGLSK